MAEYVLKEYYIRYLKEVRKLSKSSVAHYLDAINWISRYLREKGLLNDMLYEVLDIEGLEDLRRILSIDVPFREMDERGHRMYTAGLNNYLRFAHGEEFSTAGASSVMDIPMPPSERTMEKGREVWRRSGIIKDQSIEMAHYQCEVNGEHKTFIAARTGHPYMEAHHAIPIRLQGVFDTSLDVYANIICLCPICHRLLHYGMAGDRTPVLSKVYHDRADRLAKSGIRVSKDEFLELVI